jgi:hypothetical protein
MSRARMDLDVSDLDELEDWRHFHGRTCGLSCFG